MTVNIAPAEELSVLTGLTEITRLAGVGTAVVVRPGGLLVIADLCQREPFAGEDKAVLDGMLDTLHIAGVNSPDERRARVTEAGWRPLELMEIGEQVRPSYVHVGATFRESAASLPAPAAEQIIGAAGLMEAFGKHPHADHVLITA
jgi:hypothetical protein